MTASPGTGSGPPGGVDLAEVVAAFGQLLHAAGVPVTPERSGRFATAWPSARPAAVDEIYWAGRVTLLSGADQIDAYDAVFAQVFRGVADVADWRGQAPSALAAPEAHPPGGRTVSAARRGPDRAPGGAEPPGPRHPPVPAPVPGRRRGADLLAAASAEERLGHTDLADLTPTSWPTLRRLHGRAAVGHAPPARPAHGSPPPGSAARPAGHAPPGPDDRRRPRAPVVPPPHRPPRHLVLIADVSGSMEPYARAYLHLLHGAVRAARADAFVFATRLTWLTRALATSNPDLALRRATVAAPDWSGGTRIGDGARRRSSTATGAGAWPGARWW